MPNKHLANSLFLAALKGSVSPLSKKSISHENLNIKDIFATNNRVFPLEVFHTIRFLSQFFVT